MTMNELHYDVKYINYEVDFNTIIDGINYYKDTVYVLNQKEKPESIRIEYFKNVVINAAGEYSTTNKKAVMPFVSFQDYYDRLVRDMKKLAMNAADKCRCHQYDLVTTISKGYDAPCCAAIAHKLGCNTALTFRAEGKYVDDCGSDIAKTMGYENVIEIDPNEYKTHTDLIEVEHICSGELGSSLSFVGFDKHIQGKILLTGDRGDSVWGRFSENRNNEFAFKDMLSHLSDGERRLWSNHISVPMPLYGARAWTSIYDISNSDEMRPWCVNKNYDRPIPRRIVEETGVKREAFGVEKHGAGFVYKFDWMQRVKSRMSPTAAADFERYVQKHRQFRPMAVMLFFWKLRGVYLRRLGVKMKGLSPDEIGKIANPMAPAYLIPWSGEHMINRYNDILKG